MGEVTRAITKKCYQIAEVTGGKPVLLTADKNCPAVGSGFVTTHHVVAALVRIHKNLENGWN